MDDQVSPVETRPADRMRTMPREFSTPPRSRLRVGWILLLLALLAAAGVAWWLQPWAGGSGGKHGAAGGDQPQPVGEATVGKGDMPVALSGLGTVTPLQTVTVKTQINGQLVQIAFTEGQMVKQGDFLAQIDPRPYQAALDQDQGTLLRDQALLAEARLDLARYQRLSAQDSIARQQVDTQVSLVHQYEGTVKTDQAQVDSAKLNLVYCHITSPVTGRVGLRQVDQGNYVQTSDANGLVVLTQLQPMSVLFTLPEDNLPQIMKRLAAGAKLPVTAYDRSNTSKLATGVLATLDNQIDTTTGTVKLRAMFDNADDALFPNQFVNIRLLVDTVHDTVIVPSAAVQTGSPGTYVYLIKPDDTVSVRPIKLGVTDGERSAVLSGLAVGDKVVVDGTDRLHEGSKVTIPDPATAASPSGEHGRHRHKPQS